MIYTSLKTINHFGALGLGGRFEVAFNYLRTLQAGRDYDLKKVDLIPGEVSATIMINAGRSPDKAPLEYHRRYADIHLCLAGNEQIGWRDDLGHLTPRGPFNDEDDYGLLEESFSQSLILEKGQLVIFFPEETHSPLMGEGTITKVCVKVLVT